MNDTIITALIMALSSIVCQVLINRNNRAKQKAEDAEKERDRAVKEAIKETKLDDRLTGIEAQLREHNQYAEKFQTVADKFTEVAKDIASINTSIDFLKDK